jgi:hypothetical protein
MPPNFETYRRNALPIALTATLAAGASLAVAESVSAESLPQPTPITYDIGALPAPDVFQAPALAAGSTYFGSPFTTQPLEYSATTSTKPKHKSTYSMVNESKGPISISQEQSLSDRCKYQAFLEPGSPGPHNGMLDNTTRIHARAIRHTGDDLYSYYYTLRKHTVLCKILGAMQNDDTNSVYEINPIKNKRSKNKGKVIDTPGDYYDLASIVILARKQK